MTNYKSYRIVDGRPRLVIVDENGKIINNNPDKEELRSLKIDEKKYNVASVCDNIKKDGKRCENKLIPGKAYKEYDEKGKWTGRWLCKNCYSIDRWSKDVKRTDSRNNIRKSLTDRRAESLDPDSNQAKGDMFEELTCRWRGVKNLNIENDNFNSPIDHSRDLEFGILQTKGRLYDTMARAWFFANFEKEWYKEFDNMICYCASKDGKDIKRIYVFPKEEILKRKTIGIYKNPTDSWGNPITPWYEQYRVKDEDVKKVNEIWKKIIEKRFKKLQIN